MHIRSRLHHRRLQISLVDTRRVDGKVRQEHVASLGSIPPDMTAVDRVTFWTLVHPRLARIDNRLDDATLAKVMRELHAKVPMVATGDEEVVAHKIRVAEHNADIWTAVRDSTLATVADKREYVAILTAQIAEGEKLAADAAGYAAVDREKVERLKAGEDVNVGKELDISEVCSRAGWTTADMRQATRLAALDEAELAEVVPAIVRGHKLLEMAVVSRLYKRHIRAKR
jgi:hypothetical protein